MRFSALLMAVVALSLAPLACKKKSSGGSGGSGIRKDDLKGLWVNKGEDVFLQFSDKNYSSFGNAAVSTGCAVEQTYEIKGNTVVIAKADPCKDLTITLNSLDAKKLVALNGKDKFEMDKISSGGVRDIFAKKGLTKDKVTAPFKEFAGDVGGQPAVPATGQFDSINWQELAGYSISFTKNTAPEDAYRPWFQPYRVMFQNGAIKRGDGEVSKNKGEVVCSVVFRMFKWPRFIGDEDAVLSPSLVNLPLEGAYTEYHMFAHYTESGVGISVDGIMDYVACEKYDTTKDDVMLIGDLRKAFGDFMTIQKR